MSHRVSEADEAFHASFHRFELPAGGFDHLAHLRMAYVTLCRLDPAEAVKEVRRSLHAFIEHNEVDPAKYHETITRAWVMAVRHFMDETAPCRGFEEFIERNARLADAKIMLQHYTPELLYSEGARARWVEPDVAPIPAG